MKFNGSVNINHFGHFYSLMVEHDADWELQDADNRGHVRFCIQVQDAKAADFKDKVCRLLPCVEFDKELSLFQKIKNYFKLKGDTCEQCC